MFCFLSFGRANTRGRHGLSAVVGSRKALSAKRFQGLPPVALPPQASMPLSRCLAAAAIPPAGLEGWKVGR